MGKNAHEKFRSKGGCAQRALCSTFTVISQIWSRNAACLSATSESRGKERPYHSTLPRVLRCGCPCPTVALPAHLLCFCNCVLQKPAQLVVPPPPPRRRSACVLCNLWKVFLVLSETPNKPQWERFYRVAFWCWGRGGGEEWT